MKSFKAKNVHQEFQGAGQAPRDHDERGVMPAFSNLKTGTKITATFLVVAVLLIAVAAVGYVSLKSVNAGMTTLYEDRLLPTQQLGRVNDAQLKIKRDLYQYILVSEDRNNLERDIADHIQSADKSIKQYEATYLVPDEERGLAEFRPAWAAYLRAVEDFLRQAKAGNTVQ
jgi:methyl-accepting chemotaxis protein